MKELDLAYMAGVFDGEGTIYIAKRTERNAYFLQCRVGITREYIPNLFQYHFGGSVYFVDTVKENPNWRPAWYWSVSSYLARAFLEIISPYLRLKKAEAELGIAFQRRKGLRGRHQTKEAKAIEEAQWILMHNLKKGGTIDEKINTF